MNRDDSLEEFDISIRYNSEHLIVVHKGKEVFEFLNGIGAPPITESIKSSFLSGFKTAVLYTKSQCNLCKQLEGDKDGTSCEIE